MDNQNYLGIYLSKTGATVVYLNAGKKVLDCFALSVEDAETSGQETLAGMIAKECSERGLKFTEVAVALDCSMFMQHKIHSEFTDPKQISATIRFDTEEALAYDVSNIAIAYKITFTQQQGAELSVFTSQQKILSEIILALQSNNIDPVSIEPDVNCLWRFINEKISPTDLEGQGTFFAMLSGSNGYFIIAGSTDSQLSTTERTFLIGPSQDRELLLIREMPLTLALIGGDKSVNNVKIFDSTGSVDYRDFSEKLGIETSELDLISSAETPEIASGIDPVNFAISYGAALAPMEKIQTMNFRNDFMPYQGKKMRLQKTLKYCSISATVLLLALGLYVQTQLFQKNTPRKQLREKFSEQYSSVMLGKKMPGMKTAVKKLSSELRRTQNVKSGQISATGEKSVASKLTMVLEAFNKCASKTKLHIDKISVTSKSIGITGETSSKKNTIALLDSLKNSDLEVLQYRYDEQAGMTSFNISVTPKK